jgi:hypothetical protein
MLITAFTDISRPVRRTSCFALLRTGTYMVNCWLHSRQIL